MDVRDRWLATLAVACAAVVLLAAFPPWRRVWEPLPGGGWHAYEVDVGDTSDSGNDPTEDVMRVLLGLAALGLAAVWRFTESDGGKRRWAAFGAFAAAFVFAASQALAASLGRGTWDGRGLGGIRPDPDALYLREEWTRAAGVALWAALAGLLVCGEAIWLAVRRAGVRGVAGHAVLALQAVIAVGMGLAAAVSLLFLADALLNPVGPSEGGGMAILVGALATGALAGVFTVLTRLQDRLSRPR